MQGVEKVNQGQLDFSTWSKPQITHFIIDLEQRMLKLPQLEIPVKHYHGFDAYAREVEIPKGTVLTGAIYKQEHINILSKGEISVLSIDGGLVRIKAPCTIVSSAGVKRLAYAHEDCVWTTIFGTNESDTDKIMEMYTVKESVCQQ